MRKQLNERSKAPALGPLSQPRMPTLTDLKAAETIEDTFLMLQHNYGNLTGWSMGHSLVRSGEWMAVNEYITILQVFPKNTVANKLQAQDASGKSFIELITIPEVPANVVFNVLNNSSINDEHIKKIARISGLKERVKCYIDKLKFASSHEKLLLWKQCVAIDTSLGKFFRRTRPPHGCSKFYSDYAKTTIVESIEKLVTNFEPEVTLKLTVIHNLENRTSFTSPTVSTDRTIEAPSLFNSSPVSFFTDTQDQVKLNQTVSPNLDDELDEHDDIIISHQVPYMPWMLLSAGLAAVLLSIYSAGSFLNENNDNKSFVF